MTKRSSTAIRALTLLFILPALMALTGPDFDIVEGVATLDIRNGEYGAVISTFGRSSEEEGENVCDINGGYTVFFLDTIGDGKHDTTFIDYHHVNGKGTIDRIDPVITGKTLWIC